MAYTLSTNVGIYPSAQRGQHAAYSESRISTEANTARFLSSIVDKEGFVISDIDEWNAAASKGALNFILYGYYITIEDSQLILNKAESSWENIYAVIMLHKVTPSGNVLEQYEVVGTDDVIGTETSTYYKGIEFNNTGTSSFVIPSGESETDYFSKKLLLFSKSDDEWIIPVTSGFRLTTKTLQFDVDCGEV